MFDDSVLIAEKIAQVFALSEEIVVSKDISGIRMRGR